MPGLVNTKAQIFMVFFVLLHSVSITISGRLKHVLMFLIIFATRLLDIMNFRRVVGSYPCDQKERHVLNRQTSFHVIDNSAPFIALRSGFCGSLPCKKAAVDAHEFEVLPGNFN